MSAPHVCAVLHFPDRDGRPEGWGRLLRLAANGADIATLSKLVRGDALRLSFEVQGESFELVRADLLRVWRDADGYFVGEARFLDEEMKARLAKALLDLLAAKPDG